MKKGKAQFAYYKRFPRDFFEGTVGMPFELKAAYGLFIDILHMHGGSVPDEPAFISGMLGVSRRKWFLLKTDLLATGKLVLDRGIWSNPRVDLELGIDRASEAYQRIISGLSRDYRRDNPEINGSGSNEIKDLPVSNQNQNQNQKEEGGSSGARERASKPETAASGGAGLGASDPNACVAEALALRPAMLEALGADPVNGWHPGLERNLLTTEDVAEVQRWLGLPMITAQVILAEIRPLALKAGNKFKTFRYFAPHFQRLSGRLSTPLEPLSPTMPKGKQRISKNAAFDASIHQLAERLNSGQVDFGIARSNPYALQSRQLPGTGKCDPENLLPE